MKRRIPSSSAASAQGPSPILLVEGLPTLRESNDELLFFSSISLQSSRNRTLQSQLHQVILFSHYSSTELSKERLLLVEILQPAFQGLASSRCHPFFRPQQSNTRIVFREPGDNHNEPYSSDVRSLTITLLVQCSTLAVVR